MVECTNAVNGLSAANKDPHNDHRQIIRSLRQEISMLVSSMSTFIAKLDGSDKEPQKKNKKGIQI